MTIDERIEAAARALNEAVSPQDFKPLEWLKKGQKQEIRAKARKAIAAAFPELSGDKPGWIAPWEPTDAMCHAVVAGTLEDDVTDAVRWDVGYEWRILRDAYLGEGNAG